MLFLSFVHHYLRWHYFRAWSELFHVWLNLLWFTIHFFSIPQLMRTWFSPWKRIVEERGNKWNLEDLAGFIIIGLISRLLGFIMRTVIIMIGLVCLFLVVSSGLLFFVFWFGAPFVIIALLGVGITLLTA
ncbi:hypothetical protein H6778_01800 [Candidatus Nomurabacteria bacterium]|nr:hypothetical protein [Candidatus Nomurabacteria bacterium]